MLLGSAVVAGCGGGGGGTSASATSTTTGTTTGSTTGSTASQSGYTTFVSITVSGTTRTIDSNGIPDHAIGQFPNPGNPNSMSPQNYEFTVTTAPTPAGSSIPLGFPASWGVAVNGIPLDPYTANFYNGNRNWRYSALYNGGASFGLDFNNAHVQPNGAYHYHGIPTAFMEARDYTHKMVMVGWAADGYPVYGPYCYSDPNDPKSALKAMTSSYVLRSGSRPSAPYDPGGTYDGTFDQDYQYVPGAGDLDQNNGRTGVTPEYPKGTYYYMLSTNYPIIPHSFHGTPDPSFDH
jgi:hypothetical protein